MAGIERRLRKLEDVTGTSVPVKALCVLWRTSEEDEGEELVTILEPVEFARERMTVNAFRKRFPHGDIIFVEWGDTPEETGL